MTDVARGFKKAVGPEVSFSRPGKGNVNGKVVFLFLYFFESSLEDIFIDFEREREALI